MIIRPGRNQKLMLACAFVPVFSFLLMARTCPFDAPSWQQGRSSEKNAWCAAPSFESMDDACFLVFVQTCGKRIPESERPRKMLRRLKEYVVPRNTFSRQLLVAIMQEGFPAVDPDAWDELLSIWEQRNGRFDKQVSALTDAGRLHEADTLYMIFDAHRRLDNNGRRQWARLKAILDDFQSAARLLCLSGNENRQAADISQSWLAYMLADEDSLTISRTLAAYRQCRLESNTGDTVALRDWLGRIYARFGLHDEQREILILLKTAAAPTMNDLAVLARNHFSRQRYEHAIRCARAAYRYPAPEPVASFCATILYQSYVQLGGRDSALVWLERANLKDRTSAIRAIALYQSAGIRDKADSLLHILPPGLARDTLLIRRLLFAGKPDSAFSLAKTLVKNSRGGSAHDVLLLWRIRTALYARNFTALTAALDSIDIDPAREHAPEILEYRYRSKRIADDAATRDDWAALEYALARGAYQAAIDAVRPQRYSPRGAQTLVILLVRRLLEQDRVDEAGRVIEKLNPQFAVPEQTCYYAEILLRQGKIEQARELLHQLILAHPHDIYSSKARMLLMQLER